MPEIPYTVRLAPELLERSRRRRETGDLDRAKLIRALLAEHFAEDRGAPRGRVGQPVEPATRIRPDSLRSDPRPTHGSAPARSPGGSEVTDQIRQTAQQEAERYMQRLRRKTI